MCVCVFVWSLVSTSSSNGIETSYSGPVNPIGSCYSSLSWFTLKQARRVRFCLNQDAYFVLLCGTYRLSGIPSGTCESIRSCNTLWVTQCLLLIVCYWYYTHMYTSTQVLDWSSKWSATYSSSSFATGSLRAISTSSTLYQIKNTMYM